jgi:hypothetical protein
MRTQKQTWRINAVLVAAGFILLVAGCTSTSHVMVGKKRPPISPVAVKVYWDPPAEYEKIAILDSSSEWSFKLTQQGQMNAVIERLKKEAAKLGANGVLLQDVDTRYIRTGTLASGTAEFADTPRPEYGSSFEGSAPVKVARGIAIHVKKE